MKHILAAIIILTFVSACVGTEPTGSRVIVTNQYGKDISNGYLGVCKEKLSLDRLENEKSMEFNISNECDGPYIVDIEFTDGSKVKNAGGYYIVGSSVIDEIIISEESILLRRNCEINLVDTTKKCTEVYW